MSEWLEARNILAVRMDNIGDVLMLGPALRAIKETSPEARITLLASPAGSSAASLLPWIDDVIVWRAPWQDVGHRVPFDPVRERELIDLLAERAFDAALVFTSFSQTPHVPGYVCYLAGIPLRAGESKEFGGTTLSTQLAGTPEDAHQVERNLRLIEDLGFTVRDRQLEACIPHQARRVVPWLLQEAGLDPGQPYVLVHPGASAIARRYPSERFAEVVRLLLLAGHQVLVTGTDRERAIVEIVLTEALAVVPGISPGVVPGFSRGEGGASKRAGSLIGKVTLPEYAALIDGAALVICNDSLPLHLADAVGTPEVVLFSGTDYEEQWRPRRTRARLLRRETACHPCYLFDCPIGLPCLDIPPAEVVSEAEAFLSHAPSHAPLPISGGSV